MSGRTLNSVLCFWKDFGQRTGATFCPGVPLAKVVGHTCSFSYCAHEIQHAIRFASEVALVCVKCELWVYQIVRETVPAKLDVPGVCQPSSWRSMMDPLKLGYQDWDEDTPEDDSKIILVLCISRKSIASPLAKAHFRRLTKIVKLTLLDLLKVKQVVPCTCTGGQSQRLLVVSEKCSQPGQLGRKFYCRFLSLAFAPYPCGVQELQRLPGVVVSGKFPETGGGRLKRFADRKSCFTHPASHMARHVTNLP